MNVYTHLSFWNSPRRSTSASLSWHHHFISILTIAMTLTCGLNTNVAAANLLPGQVASFGGDENSGVQNIPSDLTDVKAIAVGYNYSLALKNDGTVKAWGLDDNGQVRGASGVKNVKAIAAGSRHALALKNDGTVVAWGYDDFGLITGGSGLTNVKAISAGTDYNLALKEDGTVVVWGNYSAELIIGAFELTNVKAISAGHRHALALKNDGSVVAWGSKDWGESVVPPDLADVKAIAAGTYHSMALKNDGAVVVWGDWYNRTPPSASDLTNAKAISAGTSHRLVLKNDGTVLAWGADITGQVSGLSGLTGVTVIATGSTANHSLVANLVSAPTYTLSGFQPPVNNPDVVNLGKAGRTYPVKWQLKDAAGNFVTSLAAIKSITFKPVQCGMFTSVQADALETETSGNSGLTYDDISNQYRYNWAAPSAGCYVLFLSFDTGQVQQAYFNLRP